MRTLRVSLLLLGLTAAACGGGEIVGAAPTDPATGEPVVDPGAPTQGGDPTSPGMTGTAPSGPKATFAGVYGVTAPLDFTKDGVFPGSFGKVLQALSEIHDRPGKAIITILRNSGDNDIADILNSIPGFIRSLLEGLLDNAIKRSVFQGNRSLDEIATVTQGIFQVTKTMQLHDELTVHTPNAQGVATIDQTLTGVTFTLLNKSQHVQFTKSMKVMQMGQVTQLPNSTDGDLAIGTATFDFPMGELLLAAVGPLVYDLFGVSRMRDVLQQVIDCDSVGFDVSDGLDGFIDPSTASFLCMQALALVGDQVERQIKNLTWNGVQVLGGKARLKDASMSRPQTDLQADSVSGGTWTWRFTIDGQSADVPSTFSGDRIGAAR